MQGVNLSKKGHAGKLSPVSTPHLIMFSDAMFTTDAKGFAIRMLHSRPKMDHHIEIVALESQFCSIPDFNLPSPLTYHLKSYLRTTQSEIAERNYHHYNNNTTLSRCAFAQCLAKSVMYNGDGERNRDDRLGDMQEARNPSLPVRE
jgi:hypothetical protein